MIEEFEKGSVTSFDEDQKLEERLGTIEMEIVRAIEAQDTEAQARLEAEKADIEARLELA